MICVGEVYKVKFKTHKIKKKISNVIQGKCYERNSTLNMRFKNATFEQK
jgi:hypothetical protein